MLRQIIPAWRHVAAATRHTAQMLRAVVAPLGVAGRVLAHDASSLPRAQERAASRALGQRGMANGRNHMLNALERSAGSKAAAIFTAAIVLAVACPLAAKADDAAAKDMLKAMSDYLAAQKSIAFGYDTNFEVVTKDRQKIALASSGAIELSRPDKVRARRTGGFADVEMVFDGKTLTLLGKNANMYAQADMPGTVDQLIDTLREKLHRPIPGADLLETNVYDALMPEVTDAKDLGSGVIGGIECDHLAFRTEEVDWQIWIAQGANPYPCRYVVTSKKVDQAPQYSIQIRDWKAGGDVAAGDFTFANSTNAKQIDAKDIAEASDLPEHFKIGDAQ
jgi:hypothetical protein